MAKITAKTIRAFFSTPRRWCKNFAEDENGRYCLYGALEKVYGSTSVENKEATWRLRRAIYETTGGLNIAEFNDAPTTTFADIQRVVRKAKV